MHFLCGAWEHRCSPARQRNALSDLHCLATQESAARASHTAAAGTWLSNFLPGHGALSVALAAEGWDRLCYNQATGHTQQGGRNQVVRWQVKEPNQTNKLELPQLNSWVVPLVTSCLVTNMHLKTSFFPNVWSSSTLCYMTMNVLDWSPS